MWSVRCVVRRVRQSGQVSSNFRCGRKWNIERINIDGESKKSLLCESCIIIACFLIRLDQKVLFDDSMEKRIILQAFNEIRSRDVYIDNLKQFLTFQLINSIHA